MEDLDVIANKKLFLEQPESFNRVKSELAQKIMLPGFSGPAMPFKAILDEFSYDDPRRLALEDMNATLDKAFKNPKLQNISGKKLVSKVIQTRLAKYDHAINDYVSKNGVGKGVEPSTYKAWQSAVADQAVTDAVTSGLEHGIAHENFSKHFAADGANAAMFGVALGAGIEGAKHLAKKLSANINPANLNRIAKFVVSKAANANPLTAVEAAVASGALGVGIGAYHITKAGLTEVEDYMQKQLPEPIREILFTKAVPIPLIGKLLDIGDAFNEPVSSSLVEGVASSIPGTTRASIADIGKEALATVALVGTISKVYKIARVLGLTKVAHKVIGAAVVDKAANDTILQDAMERMSIGLQTGVQFTYQSIANLNGEVVQALRQVSAATATSNPVHAALLDKLANSRLISTTINSKGESTASLRDMTPKDLLDTIYLKELPKLPQADQQLLIDRLSSITNTPVKKGQSMYPTQQELSNKLPGTFAELLSGERAFFESIVDFAAKPKTKIKPVIEDVATETAPTYGLMVKASKAVGDKIGGLLFGRQGGEINRAKELASERFATIRRDDSVGEVFVNNLEARFGQEELVDMLYYMEKTGNKSKGDKSLDDLMFRNRNNKAMEFVDTQVRPMMEKLHADAVSRKKYLPEQKITDYLPHMIKPVEGAVKTTGKSLRTALPSGRTTSSLTDAITAAEASTGIAHEPIGHLGHFITAYRSMLTKSYANESLLQAIVDTQIKVPRTKAIVSTKLKPRLDAEGKSDFLDLLDNTTKTADEFVAEHQTHRRMPAIFPVSQVKAHNLGIEIGDLNNFSPKDPTAWIRSSDPTIVEFAKKAYPSYKINLTEVLIHPDYAYTIRQIFDKPAVTSIMHHVTSISAAAKIAELSASLFHFGALGEAHFDSVVARGIVDKKFDSLNIFQAIQQGKMSEMDLIANEMQASYGLHTGSAKNDLDVALAAKGFKAANAKIASWFENQPVLKKIFQGAVDTAQAGKEVQDEVLWSVMHRGLKSYWFNTMFKDALVNPVYKGMSTDEIGKTVADIVNTRFGGLNWDEMFRISGAQRQALQVLFLAKDWTYAHVRQIGDMVSSNKAKALHARAFTISQLAVLASATEAANLALTGKHMTESEPGHLFDIQLPGKDEEGRTRWIHAGKPLLEKLSWFQHPVKSFGGKMGPISRTFVEQLTGAAAGSGFASKDIQEKLEFASSAIGRAKSIANMFKPFSLSDTNFAFTYPMKKGTSNYKAVEEVSRILSEDWRSRGFLETLDTIHRTMLIDPTSFFKSKNARVIEWLGAAENNGLDPAEVLSSARSKAASADLQGFWRAFQENDYKAAEKLAEQMTRKGIITKEGFMKSADNITEGDKAKVNRILRDYVSMGGRFVKMENLRRKYNVD